MQGRRSTYLIQNPYEREAIEFIRTIELHYGLRPVCFYTDVKARHYGERAHPELRSDLIESSHDVSLDDLATFAGCVSEIYDVVGIVPFREDTVEVAAELCPLLGIKWNDPETLLRFRDKFAQRSYLRDVAPHVRVPFSALVRSHRELHEIELPERFVVKPNDGLGNVSIGVFDRGQLEAAAEHVEQGWHSEWIVEEFIGGIEYHADGQVRPDGSVDLLAVYEYVRKEINGYPTVYLDEIQCRTNEAPFQEVASYTFEVLGATGLRSCPFHLEVKVDDDGPCIIDLAARFAGQGTARSLTHLHPERPSAYVVAAHDYLGRSDALDLPLSWDHYDSVRSIFVFGVSEEEALITSVHGADEVEALPGFLRWELKPEIGRTVERTRALLEAPWVLEMVISGSREDAFAIADQIRSMVGWNRDGGVGPTVVARFLDLGGRVRRKGRWLATRGIRAVRSRMFGA